MSSQRATRGGEDSRNRQKELWEKEMKELEEKPEKSGKEEKRLEKLRKRLQAPAEPIMDSPLPDQSKASEGMEDVTFTAPVPSKPSKQKRNSPSRTVDQIDDETSENESQTTAPSIEKAGRERDSSDQPTQQARVTTTQKPEEAGEYRFAEAYCRSNSFEGKSRMVYGYGTHGNAKYEIGESKEHTKEELEVLPLVSGKNESILEIRKNGRHIYGFINIKEVVNVASLESKPNRGWRATQSGKIIRVFPTTIVKIRWSGIKEEHQSLLKNEENWNLRSKLMARLKKTEKSSLDKWIRESASKQDAAYRIWHKDNNISSKERSPTFFPGEGWTTEDPPSAKVKRAERRSGRIKTKATNKEKQPNQVSGNGDKFSGRKRPRSDSTADPDTIKKPRFIPKPQDGRIDYDTYLCTNMNHYGLDTKKLNEDPQGYRDQMHEIKAGWDEYVKLMKEQGYTIAPEGDKPANS